MVVCILGCGTTNAGNRGYGGTAINYMRIFDSTEGAPLSPELFKDQLYYSVKTHWWGFPGGAVVENLPANAGDTGSSPGLGRSHMPRSN